jgi:hypothetical protein
MCRPAFSNSGHESVAGQQYKRVVRLRGYKDAHVHAAQCGELQCGDELLVGHEIGAGDPHPIFGGVNGVEKKERASLERIGRAGGETKRDAARHARQAFAKAARRLDQRFFQRALI